MRFVVLVVIAFVLAGCTAPTIPDDAIEVATSELPDGKMWMWLVEGDGFTVIHGYFDYSGQELLHTRQCDPRGAWNLTITDASGAEVIFDPRPCRHPEFQPESYSHRESFQFTWQHEEYERFEQGGLDEDVAKHPVSAGNYTATLQYGIAWQERDLFQAALPIVIA